jgi:hypothetical protein
VADLVALSQLVAMVVLVAVAVDGQELPMLVVLEIHHLLLHLKEITVVLVIIQILAVVLAVVLVVLVVLHLLVKVVLVAQAQHLQ